MRATQGRARGKWLSALGRVTCVCLAALASAHLPACGSDGKAQLAVDLTTDYRPGVDFSEVRTTISQRDGPASAQRSSDAVTAGYFEPKRVALFDDLEAGQYAIAVELVTSSGDVIASRRRQRLVEANALVPVVITSDCAEVTCPDGDPLATECLGGRCVRPECATGEEERCPESACERDADCAPRVACAEPVCVSTVCLHAPRDERCDGEAVCDVREGCRSVGAMDVPNGDACDADSDCMSGHCDNGFCCDTGLCCSTTTDCPGGGGVGTVCDDPSTCQGTRGEVVCESSRCMTLDGIDDDSACDSSTKALDCDPYQPVYCAGESSQPAPSCPTSCDGDGGCLDGYHCDGSDCTADLTAGDSCSSDGQCADGLSCVDGVCCTSSSCGTCESCALSGTEGTCTPHPEGTDPDDECPGGLACSVGASCTCPSGSGTMCVAGTSLECDDSGESWTGSDCCVDCVTECVDGSRLSCDDAGEHWTGELCCFDGPGQCTTGYRASCDDYPEEWTGERCCVWGASNCVDGNRASCDNSNEEWTGQMCCITTPSVCVAGTSSSCRAEVEEWTGETCCLLSSDVTCTDGELSQCGGPGDPAEEEWTGAKCCILAPDVICTTGSWDQCNDSGEYWTGTNCCVENVSMCVDGTASGCSGNWTGTKCCA